MVAGKLVLIKKPRRFRRKLRGGLNKAQKKQVKKIISKNQESKFLDLADTDSSVISTSDNTTAMNQFRNIAQGDGESERVGNSVRHKGIGFNHIISSSVSNVLRHLIIMTPTASLNSDLDTALNGTNMGVNKYLPRETSKYKVLLDKSYSININATALAKKLHLKGYIPLKLKKQVFDGDTASDAQSFYIQEYFYTDNATASVITRDSKYRSFYKDS